MSGSRTQSIVWALMVGLLAFAAVELLVVGGLLQPPRLYYAWGGVVLVPVFVYALAEGVASGGAGVAERLHQPKASVATPARQYSQARSLAARGQFRGAVRLYEEAVKQNPEHFEPYLQIARIYRDDLEHFELAVRWYERARAQVDLNEAQEFMISNELIELFRHQLKAPQRELVELEKLISRFPDHPSATGVERDLRRLREDLKPPTA